VSYSSLGLFKYEMNYAQAFLDVILINASIISRETEFGASGGGPFTVKPPVGAAHAASGVTGLRCLC